MPVDAGRCRLADQWAGATSSAMLGVAALGGLPDSGQRPSVSRAASAVQALIDSIPDAPATTSRVDCASSARALVAVMWGSRARIRATIPETLAVASELPVAKS